LHHMHSKSRGAGRKTWIAIGSLVLGATKSSSISTRINTLST